MPAYPPTPSRCFPRSWQMLLSCSLDKVSIPYQTPNHESMPSTNPSITCATNARRHKEAVAMANPDPPSHHDISQSPSLPRATPCGNIPSSRVAQIKPCHGDTVMTNPYPFTPRTLRRSSPPRGIEGYHDSSPPSPPPASANDATATYGVPGAGCHALAARSQPVLDPTQKSSSTRDQT